MYDCNALATELRMVDLSPDSLLLYLKILTKPGLRYCTPEARDPLIEAGLIKVLSKNTSGALRMKVIQ